MKLQPALRLLLLDPSGLPCPSSSLFSSQQLFLPGHEMPALVCQLLYCTTVLFKVLYCKTGASQVVLVIKNPPANGGDLKDMGLTPGSGRSPGVWHGNALQYSCLENPHGQRSLVSYCPQGLKEADMNEALSTYCNIKNALFFCLFILCIICVKSIINLLQ